MSVEVALAVVAPRLVVVKGKAEPPVPQAEAFAESVPSTANCAQRVPVPPAEDTTRLVELAVVETEKLVVVALPKMLPPVQVFELASRVVEATVMLAVPSKETPLMVRAVASAVAVAALPPMLREEVAAKASAVPAAFE